MSVLIIAEAGSNWRTGSPAKDLAFAKKLIDIAAKAGADAVKFQVFRADTTYAKGSGPCAHLREKGIGEDIGEVFADLEMPGEMIPKLADHCQKRGIAFMASTFSEGTFRLVDPFVEIHKIASPELHDPLALQLAAESEKPTLLSTGLATLDEVAWAVDLYQKHGGRGLTLLQCTVQYPTDPEAVNLRALSTLSRTFALPVGLSDHTRDPIAAPCAAVALGAKVIEKHFTLHNDLVGPDHMWAITGEELKEMVSYVRLVERMLGDGEKRILPEEESLRASSRRSIQATRPISKGTSLQLGTNIAILRPGTQPQGIHPRYLEAVNGKTALRDLETGVGINDKDYE